MDGGRLPVSGETGMESYTHPLSENFVPLWRRRPTVLELEPRNALEGVLRYIPMESWPTDTRRSTFMAFYAGDPELCANMAVLARRYIWFNTIECSACARQHCDVMWSRNRIFRPDSKWLHNRWYACNLCHPCYALFSSTTYSRETHFWCGMCKDWIHKVYHYDCEHYIPSAIEYSDDSS